MAARKYDLRWEILPIFEVVVGLSLGFIFYGQRLTGLERAGTDHYGPDGWSDMGDWIRWLIPAIAGGIYLALSLGMWGIQRIGDPLMDVNFLRRLSGRAPLTDPGMREALRGRLFRSLYLLKVVIGAISLFVQFFFCQYILGKLNLGGF